LITQTSLPVRLKIINLIVSINYLISTYQFFEYE
jgi:hypothetical protein